MLAIQPVYGSSVALTTTNLQSLAYSSTFLGAWSSAAVDNTMNLSDDEIISVILKMGTSPSVNTGRCEVWGWEALTDTPTYPDPITGSEGTVTFSSTMTKIVALKYVNEVFVDNVTGRVLPLTFRLTQIFHGTMPRIWGLAIVNITGVALSSSGNVVTRIPVQWQAV